jgi:inosose dehydratase
MTTIEVGCVQITWSRETPEDQVLAEIAQAGYAGAPASPPSGRTAAEIQALFASHNLKPAPGYLGADFWRADQRASILDRARQYAALMRELGCTELYVAAGGFNSHITSSGRSRNQLAGHVAPSDALTGAEYQTFADTLNQVGEITLREGVRSCFHNHVGSVIETREEVDRLLALADPALMFLGPDTGHLAWAGADPVAFCRDYAARIKSIQLKDVSEAVRARGVTEGWDYATFTANGIFAELGEGSVDFPAIVTILRDAGFSGWMFAETDVTQKPTALESATISRAYLRSLGL